MKTEILGLARAAAALVIFGVLHAFPPAKPDLDGFVQPPHIDLARHVVLGTLVAALVLALIATVDIVRLLAASARRPERPSEGGPYRTVARTPEAPSIRLAPWLRTMRLVGDGVLVACGLLALARLAKLERTHVTSVALEPPSPPQPLPPRRPKRQRNDTYWRCANIVEKTAICIDEGRDAFAKSPVYCENGEFAGVAECEHGRTCDVVDNDGMPLAALDDAGMPCTQVIKYDPANDSRL